MTMSYARKSSVMALSLSMALAMLIGTAAAKDRQPREKKNRGARAKKVRDGAKKDADGAKPKRRKDRLSAAVTAIVADLAAELNLTDAQKARVEEIIKKHLQAPGKGKGKDKAPGDAKKPRGNKGGGKRGGKKKGQGATKGNAGPGVDRF